MPPLRSRTVTHGRNMAGARALLRATGVTREDFGKPIVAIANSFTQFVPGHVHLRDVGQVVADAIDAAGGVRREFNTIAVDDGIAMGHGGMLYSLPSRELIADSVEYMVNAHCADALVCISNCDKITPGMLMAALRLTSRPCSSPAARWRPATPSDAGDGDRALRLDLIDADDRRPPTPRSPTTTSPRLEEAACPTCGSCSGMFTANSMNCLTEALGLALPGNGTTLATHAARRTCSSDAGRLVVELATRYYEQDDESVLPRGRSPPARRSRTRWRSTSPWAARPTPCCTCSPPRTRPRSTSTLADIDELSRRVPCICKVAPSSSYHVEDVHRAGGIPAILGELDRAGLLDRRCHTVHAASLRGVPGRLGHPRARADRRGEGAVPRRARRGARPPRPSRRATAGTRSTLDPAERLHPRPARTPTAPTAAWPSSTATWPRTAAW